MKVAKALMIAWLLVLATNVVVNALSFPPSQPPALTAPTAVVVKMETMIDGGTLELVKNAITLAKSRSAILVLYINTYGGYLAAADSIIEAVRESGLETYAFIPPGGKAVSAGALIALSTKEIYMCPGSVIGAAEPALADEKILNYVKGRFRTLAEDMFSNNETLVSVAESFVTENKVLSYDEAVELGFAKPAESLADFLRKIGVKDYAQLVPGPLETVVSLISAPLVTSLSLFLGILLIFVEVIQSGFQGYGVIGALLIVLALYGMSLIPVDMVPLAILLTGLALILGEILTPGISILGFAGIAISAAGVYLLYSSEPYAGSIQPQLIIAAGLIMGAGLIGYIGWEAGKVMKLRRLTIEAKLKDSIGVAKTKITRTEPGVVHVAGEDWTAFSMEGPIMPGERVAVVKVKGLKLYVIRANKHVSRIKSEEL